MRQLDGADAKPSFIARRHRPDLLLLLFLSILLLLGLIVIYAISPALVARLGESVDQNTFIYRQLLYLGVGLAAFTAMAMVPLRFLV